MVGRERTVAPYPTGASEGCREGSRQADRGVAGVLWGGGCDAEPDRRAWSALYCGDMSSEPMTNSWASSPGRRRNMQANRSRDTKPELEIRRSLHKLGLRYRVAIAPDPSLRRRADIVFTRARVAVFIDGCFWHGCPEHGRSNFNHNADYWPAKIAANVARDVDTTNRLREAGWQVLRFWEHEESTGVVERIRLAVLGITSAPYAKLEK